ncbi:MAG: cyclic nucleotide-binding domain-containing protein [Planctomycetota bacterium]|jgi:CRP-like cAMP-binding protein
MADEKEYSPLSNVEDVLSILNKISILAGLSDKQLRFLFELLEEIHYSAGETIFEQGQEPSHIYIVQSGKVKLVVDKEQAALELMVFEEGHCFGESSLIGIQRHSATTVAEKDTNLIVLSRKALLSIYESDLELFSILILNIAREACRRLHSSNETLLHYVKRR